MPEPVKQDGGSWSPVDRISEFMSDPAAEGAEGSEGAGTPAPVVEAASEAAEVAKADAAVSAGETDKLLSSLMAPATELPADVLGLVEKKPDVAAAVSEGEPEPPAETDMSPHAKEQRKNAWAQIKAEKKALKEQLAAREAEILAAKQQLAAVQKPPEIEEIAKMKQQIEQYEDRLGQLDITQSATFQKTYDAPLNMLFDRGMRMLVKTGMDPNEARKLAISAIDPQIKTNERADMISEQPVAVQGALMNIFEEIVDVQNARAEAIKNWKETSAAMKDQEGRTSMADMSKSIVTDTEQAVDALKAEGNWLYMESQKPEHAEWNRQVQERVRAVHGILKTAKPADLVKYVADGVTARSFRDMYLKERSRADQLAKAFAERFGVIPGVGSGSGISPSDDVVAKKADKAKPISPGDFLSSMFSDAERKSYQM